MKWRKGVGNVQRAGSEAQVSPDALNARFTELEQAISTSGFNMSGISPRDTRALRAMLESSADGAHTCSMLTLTCGGVEDALPAGCWAASGRAIARQAHAVRAIRGIPGTAEF